MTPLSPLLQAVLPEARRRVHLRWLVRLRWLALGIQIIGLTEMTLPGPVGLLPLGLLPLPLILAGLNNELLRRRLEAGGRVDGATIGASLAADMVLLAVVLSLSGGATNPFSMLFLLYLFMGSLVLPWLWVWLLYALGAVVDGLIYLQPGVHEHGQHLGGHLVGMWLAYLLIGPVIALVVGSLQRELALLSQKDAELAQLRTHADKLASLATLATGAAHELSTPLGTIAVVAHELQRFAAQHADGALKADAALIGREVRRCREVLDELVLDAGAGLGEGMLDVLASDVIDEVLEHLPRGLGPRVEVEERGDLQHFKAPARVIARALRGLVKNGLQASDAEESVWLRVDQRGDGVRFEVEDHGVGMSALVLERALDPFFSTRPEGKGMGLGMYYADSVASLLGGDLRVDSEPGRGTRVVMELPLPLELRECAGPPPAMDCQSLPARCVVCRAQAQAAGTPVPCERG